MAMQPITLTSGMRANLVSLQSTNSLMEITQKRLASGKKVNSALDDPVAYFTAVAHEQRATDLAGRKGRDVRGGSDGQGGGHRHRVHQHPHCGGQVAGTSALSADATRGRASLRAQFNEVLNQINPMAG